MDRQPPRIVYCSWPAHEITGGIKMAFRHVELLADLGFKACVATADAKPPAWFETSAPVISLKDVSPQSDVLVFPENHAEMLRQFANVECRKVVFCQNQHMIYRGLAGRNGYEDFGVNYLICPGHVTAAFCARRCARQKIFIVPYDIDAVKFQPRQPKKLQIAFAPRKRSQEAAVIQDLYRAVNPEFRAIPWVPIGKMRETQVAQVLGESALYLSLLRFEALPLSALEALASGCCVAGFTGFGGQDYATAANGFWSTEDDCQECTDQLTLATMLVVDGGCRYRSMTDEAVQTALRYDRERSQTHLAACWRAILDDRS